jgi:hypothetical protein
MKTEDDSAGSKHVAHNSSKQNVNTVALVGLVRIYCVEQITEK